LSGRLCRERSNSEYRHQEALCRYLNILWGAAGQAALPCDLIEGA
jgi:hypothetical protein